MFLPVSIAGPDFIGVDRPGANLFVDSIVALQAQTGERVWHFQTTHQDLWDYDLAAPPLLAAGGLIFHAGTKELVLHARHRYGRGTGIVRYSRRPSCRSHNL